MRRLHTLTLAAVVLLFSATQAFAQVSDYKIKKNFEENYARLNTAIQNVMEVSKLDSLQNEVSNLEYRNESHEKMLDHALYPETFDSSIDKLKQLAQSAETRLLIIESQDEKLAQLSGELASYKEELASLNSRTDSLRQAIMSSEESEEDLSALVRRYRKSMKDRDEMVLNMVDSLFIMYNDLEGDKLAELSDKLKARKISSGDNPLKLIDSMVEDNLAILKSKNSSLQTEDYLRMYVVQNRFNEIWNQIGKDMANIYGGDDSGKWKNSIDSKMKDWKASASKNMWDSMDAYLEQNNVDLGAFDNNASFYAAIEDFVNKATDSSKEKVMTQENYEDFQAFYDIWNGKIKNDWGNYVQEGEVLTMSQISNIDSEVMSWKEQAEPRSFLIPILLGLSLLTIVGLVIVLARRKQAA